MAAARWLRRLLSEALSKYIESGGSWLLRRVLEDSLPLVTRHSVTCDASPWGGGGVLWIGSKPAEYCHFTWSEHTLTMLAAKRDNTCQTLFGFLTVFLCLECFERAVRSHGVVVCGDNLATLQNSIDCKSSRSSINLVGREIAWRQALRGWRLTAAHFPKEHNVVADALSRLSAPSPLPRPTSALRGATLRVPPVQDARLWLASFDRGALT